MLELVITGKARSAVKVNCSVAVVVKLPSVTVSVTSELPLVVALPEMIPVTGSADRPGGSPVALTLGAGLPFVVYARRLNG